MPRPSLSLDSYKDLIITLFKEQDLPTEEIAHRLTNDHGLNISERTVSRRLTEWGVTRKKIRTPATQELRDRLLFHYNRNLNDAEIVKVLKAEGYEEVKPRNIARLRQKLNLRRRARFSDYGDESDEFSGQLKPASFTTHPTPKIKNTSKSKTMATSGLIPKVTAFVEQYMSKYDGSHDFNHIRRVVGLAHRIYTEIRAEPAADGQPVPALDLQVVTLAALLHDVGDKKYLEEGQDSNTLVLATLLGFGAEEELAIKVQRIVLGVSYSSEIKNPAVVMELIQRYPELAVVQDADRLDAIGAVGIGRTFTFGGAKGAREMGDTIQHFDDKLEKLEGMMKTAPGRKMARERTARLTMFKSWWVEEEKEAEDLLKRR